jgi:hypothetical protein
MMEGADDDSFLLLLVIGSVLCVLRLPPYAGTFFVGRRWGRSLGKGKGAGTPPSNRSREFGNETLVFHNLFYFTYHILFL